MTAASSPWRTPINFAPFSHTVMCSLLWYPRG
uniref:Uncharacterized protein n=1 Tax=Arundo donax TaxID=35708 RepID=A0A0A9FKV2_ARUDO